MTSNIQSSSDHDKRTFINPFPHDKIFGPDQIESICRQQIKCNKNGNSVFDRVENIVGKGEIAGTSNFSFSHNVFKKASFPDPSKGVIVWE